MKALIKTIHVLAPSTTVPMCIAHFEPALTILLHTCLQYTTAEESETVSLSSRVLLISSDSAGSFSRRARAAVRRKA